MRPIFALTVFGFALVSSLVVDAAQTHAPVLANVPETPATKLHRQLNRHESVLVIDVRSPEEFARGHISEAINIPIDSLDTEVSKRKVPKGATIVTVCERGGRSSRAVEQLRKLGYAATSFCKLEGWRNLGYPVATGTRNDSGRDAHRVSK